MTEDAFTKGIRDAIERQRAGEPAPKAAPSSFETALKNLINGEAKKKIQVDLATGASDPTCPEVPRGKDKNSCPVR